MATSVSVSIHEPGGPLNELATPSAPCSMASRTSARMRSSSAADGGPGFLAVHRGPDLARPHVAADIRRNPLLQELREVGVEILPALAGRGRPALAENHRGHALADHALRVAVFDDGEIGVVVDVDEAGRDGEAGGVDGARRGAPGQSAHGGDLPLPDGDIADVRRVAGAIDDAAAVNQQIEILRRRQHRQLQQEHPEFHNASVHRLARTPWRDIIRPL